MDVCALMVQSDTGVHQLRDENNTPYEAKPGPYAGPIGVFVGVKYCLAKPMTPSFFEANLALLSRSSRYWQSLKTLRPSILILDKTYGVCLVVKHVSFEGRFESIFFHPIRKHFRRIPQ